MIKYPEDLQYTGSHEYIRVEGDTATVGITAFAIDQLGDIVFLDLLEVGSNVNKGDRLGTIESVKAVEDIYAPLTGIVIEANTELMDEPEDIGADPYGNGWLVKIRFDDQSELVGAMSAQDYSSAIMG
ncbi:MAG: glycine cleavage system protein GcvH [Pseudanabaenaceae cyanobacterium bins.39]|nr:glycine cleavage system protein GcvH [Pseudanabaenaceae cyanobacterium bins.39]